MSHYFVEQGPLDWQRIELGIENDCFLVTDSKGQRYFLKVFSNAVSRFVKAEVNALRLLPRHGIRVPELIQSRAGEDFSCHGGVPFVLLEFVGGVAPERTPRKLREIGRIVGHIHTLHLGFELQPYHYRPEQFLRDADGCLTGPLELRRAIAEARRLFDSGLFEGLPKVFAHGDVQINNFVDAGELYAVDFEFACLEPRFHDLSRAILYACTTNGRLDTELVSALAEGYWSTAGLSEAELARAYPCTIFAGAMTAFWRYREFNVLRPDSGRRDIYLDLLQPTVDIRDMGSGAFEALLSGPT